MNHSMTYPRHLPMAFLIKDMAFLRGGGGPPTENIPDGDTAFTRLYGGPARRWLGRLISGQRFARDGMRVLWRYCEGA